MNKSPSAVPPSELKDVVNALLESYESDPRGTHVGRRYLPSRAEIEQIIELLLQLFYPGYFGAQDLTQHNLAYQTGMLVSTLQDKLGAQIECCLCAAEEEESAAQGPDVPRCRNKGFEVTRAFLRSLPTIRHKLLLDVTATFEGDPAAGSLDEIILAYPGLLAVTVYRVAHELHTLGVPLMPRIMSEWAHTKTGADIHPGARIGERFFIDHATGVVVGETTDIGAGVKLYQGVTLGALSLPRDASGRIVRGEKRHPSVEDDVTVYANATVLGGKTVLGQGSVVGGSVFVTKSVPAGQRIALEAPKVRVGGQAPASPQPPEADLDI
jgi:serine O-acetyltransferase